MKTVANNFRYWLSGVAVAACGLALTRLVGPTVTGNVRILTVLAGQLVAISGLLVICFGVSRRIRREQEGESKS